jgi:crotonobetainyl-CoA:carnitine CoA-transferase CaiB-like acyl-CoA transferase
MVAAYQGSRWPSLCDVLGLPHLVHDERFATSPQRVAHRDAMVRALSEVTRTQTTAHWLAVLRQADVLCAPVAGYDDVARHPQVEANRMIACVPHAVHGEIRGPGFPINSVQHNALPHRPAPARGEHTRAVLSGLAFDAHEIDALVDRGVLVCS